MFGHHGKLLCIDLTDGTQHIESLDEAILRRVIGGIGLATHLLFEHAPEGVSPFAPENPLVLATSPFTATPLPGSLRFAAAAKSPLTGLIGTSLCSGRFAEQLKGCGVDAVVVTGRSPSLTWIHIAEGEVVFHPAGELTGLAPVDTEARICQMASDSAVAAIGRAGEERVRFASLVSGGRFAGRTGIGAVMGSKNLKAIAICGSEPCLLFDAKAVGYAAESLRRAAPSNIRTLERMTTLDEMAALPGRNFQEREFHGAQELYEAVVAYLDREPRRLEYETLWALGPNCAVFDAETLFEAARLCDLFGLDSISVGGTIAWAMESFERGVLTIDDTDGLELNFGNHKALLQLIVAISRRQGVGDLLAEGCREAARQVGRGSDEWAMHVKGLELPGYHPATMKTMALALAVAAEGAHHNRSSAYDFDLEGPTSARVREETSQLVADAEDRSAVFDSLILNKFHRHYFEDFYAEAANLLHRITGWDVVASDVCGAGGEVNQLKHRFNRREGWRRSDDTLPLRIGGGGTLDEMVTSYYRARGWGEDGDMNEITRRSEECGD